MATVSEAEPEPASNPGSLGPAFRALLGASAVSNLGDGIRLATMPLLAAALTDDPRLVAGVTAAQFLPWLVFAPFGGVIVDRADRRRLILITQTWRGLLMIALGLTVLSGQASIGLLYVVAFLITAGEILVDPSVVATVSTLVERRRLDEANGRISAVEMVTNDLVGAPVGAGLFIAGSWIPFLADGVSYLGSVPGFARLPRTGRASEAPPSGLRQVLAEMPEGLRWIAGHRLLGPLTASVALFNVGAAAAFSLLVLLVQDTHGGSEFTFGVTLALTAMAGVVGSSMASRLVDRWHRPPVLLSASALSAATLAGVAAAPNLGVVIGFWALGGMASGVLLAIGRGFVQRYTPAEILGRAAIGSRTVTRTAFVVGAGVGGVVADAYGLRAAFAVAAGIQVVALPPLALALRHDDD